MTEEQVWVLLQAGQESPYVITNRDSRNYKAAYEMTAAGYLDNDYGYCTLTPKGVAWVNEYLASGGVR